MTRKLPLLLIPLALALLSACASNPATLDASLYQANADTRAVIQSTDAALNAHLINAEQAQSVATITAQVGPLIDSAKAANDANDPTNANKTAALIKQLLAGLAAYVAPPKTQ